MVRDRDRNWKPNTFLFPFPSQPLRWLLDRIQRAVQATHSSIICRCQVLLTITKKDQYDYRHCLGSDLQLLVNRRFLQLPSDIFICLYVLFMYFQKKYLNIFSCLVRIVQALLSFGLDEMALCDNVQRLFIYIFKIFGSPHTFREDLVGPDQRDVRWDKLWLVLLYR